MLTAGPAIHPKAVTDEVGTLVIASCRRCCAPWLSSAGALKNRRAGFRTPAVEENNSESHLPSPSEVDRVCPASRNIAARNRSFPRAAPRSEGSTFPGSSETVAAETHPSLREGGKAHRQPGERVTEGCVLTLCECRVESTLPDKAMYESGAKHWTKRLWLMCGCTA